MLSQAQHIENLNYYSDSRTQGPKEAPTLEVYNDDGECIEIIPLPTHYEVCTGCHGTGTYVNPSIDCGGLSEENHSDPEFMEAYMAGHYDVVCNSCQGKRVDAVVNWDALSEAQSEAYRQQLQDEADFRETQMAELRMGA